MTTINVFTSYSHNDEDLWDQFAKHMKALQREGIIKTWYDREIQAGKEWAQEIDSNLQRARIILLLVSADFIASDYCYDIEVSQAMELHESGRSKVIPIILRPCNWTKTPFAKLQVLPKGGRPVTDWKNMDAVFAEITQSIRTIALNLGATPLSEAGTFTKVRRSLSNLKGRTKIVITTVIVFTLIIIHGLIAPKIAIGLLEKSSLNTATRYLQIAHWTAFFNKEIDAISDQLKKPLTLQPSLIVQKSGKPIQDKPYPFNDSQTNRIVLTPKDYYKIEIEMIPSRM